MAQLYLFPDERVIIQATVYVAALVVANHYLIKPALKLHRERLKRTAGATASTAREEEKLVSLEKEYQRKLKEARDHAKELRSKEILGGQAEASEIVEQAKNAAKNRVESAAAAVESQLAAEKLKIEEVAKDVAATLLKKLTTSVPILLLGFLFSLAGQTGYAAGSGEVEFWSGVFWPYFQFACYAFVVWYFGGKIVRKVLEGRRDQLRTQLSEARQAIEAAERKISEYQGKVASLEDDIDALRAREVGDGLRKRESLILEARQQRDQIIRDAERRALEMVAASREALRREIVSAALVSLKTQLSPEVLEDIDRSLKSHAMQRSKQLN